MTRARTGEGTVRWRGSPRLHPPAPCLEAPLTTLRDEDITTTTNELPGGDADQGDSDETQVDPAGVDPAGSDPGSGGGDADQGDSSETQVDPAGSDPAGSDPAGS